MPYGIGPTLTTSVGARPGSETTKRLELSLAIASNPRTQPVLDGTTAPQGIDLVSSKIFPSETFWRQLKFAEFDVSEMSLSSLMRMMAGGDDRWLGLPVFPTRYFFHTWVLVRRDANIRMPADLRGRRVGVPEYQQTGRCGHGAFSSMNLASVLKTCNFGWSAMSRTAMPARKALRHRRV